VVLESLAPLKTKKAGRYPVRLLNDLREANRQ
jgi:hypothetical protein